MDELKMAIAYLLFFGVPVVLLAVAFWIYRPAARPGFRQAALIPLQEGRQQPRRDRNRGAGSV